MGYECIRYSDVVDLNSSGLNTFLTITPPTSSYNKVITLDVFISMGYDHDNLIARYISLYYMNMDQPNFITTQTLFEHRHTDGPSWTPYIYTDTASGPEIWVQLDVDAPGICMYDIKLEY